MRIGGDGTPCHFAIRVSDVATLGADAMIAIGLSPSPLPHFSSPPGDESLIADNQYALVCGRNQLFVFHGSSACDMRLSIGRTNGRGGPFFGTGPTGSGSGSGGTGSGGDTKSGSGGSGDGGSDNPAEVVGVVCEFSGSKGLTLRFHVNDAQVLTSPSALIKPGQFSSYKPFEWHIPEERTEWYVFMSSQAVQYRAEFIEWSPPPSPPPHPPPS